MNTIAHTNNQTKYTFTVILLCIGYFVDFYDLTIFSASYVNTFRDLFHITDTNQIQKLYLYISSIYTLGIFTGAILFGILGDKFGRSIIIRYSILIYSIAMLLSVVSSSVYFFTLLRFISGFGLATEFATSSVLINELFTSHKASIYNSYLYLCGILGGITATYLSGVSWQLMYILGGVIGIIIFFLRKNIYESLVFINIDKNISKGQILQLFNSKDKIIKFIRLLILIIPFNFLIVTMFMFPKFMNIHEDLAYLIKILLFGFFMGNVISTLMCRYIINRFKSHKVFVLINITLFAILIPIYRYIDNSNYFIYALGLGLLGGGLPTTWIQIVVRDYGANLRNTASNTLFAGGRLVGMLFNLLIANWILNFNRFNANIIITCIVIVALVLIAIFFTKNNYNQDMRYVE